MQDTSTLTEHSRRGDTTDFTDIPVSACSRNQRHIRGCCDNTDAQFTPHSPASPSRRTVCPQVSTLFRAQATLQILKLGCDRFRIVLHRVHVIGCFQIYGVEILHAFLNNVSSSSKESFRDDDEQCTTALQQSLHSAYKHQLRVPRTRKRSITERTALEAKTEKDKVCELTSAKHEQGHHIVWLRFIGTAPPSTQHIHAINRSYKCSHACFPQDVRKCNTTPAHGVS